MQLGKATKRCVAIRGSAHNSVNEGEHSGHIVLQHIDFKCKYKVFTTAAT